MRRLYSGSDCRQVCRQGSRVGKVEVQSMIGDENKQETRSLTEVRA